MDRNFHTDDFERLLREKSDEFRMYPSKRIWHSIYNNIHPGRKWPSVAMSITLITALFLMGYLNTNNPNLYAAQDKNVPVQKIIAQARSTRPASQSLTIYPGISNEVPGTSSNNKAFTSLNNSLNKDLGNKVIDPSLPVVATTQRPLISVDAEPDRVSHPDIAALKEAGIPFINGINSPQAVTNGQMGTTGDYTISSGNEQAGFSTYTNKVAITELMEIIPVYVTIPKDINKNITADIQAGTPVSKNNIAPNKKDLISAEDKAWIENYALYNRPATKKWANKLAWQLYAIPSVVYRKLYSDPDFGNTINPLPFASGASQDINNTVYQKPSIGFEVGAGFQYSISKLIKLKAGLQLNYTRYNAEAFQNTHPFTTRITMHDYETNTSYEEIRTTPYSNKSGLEAVKLHNETFQISLPIGADLKLIGNETIQWNIGATIQPTYVIGGKSYIISSDRRNYVKETSMINRWNLNAGFETFISYKANNGLTWQIGPQFRTQLFSTNSKQIAVEEKLVNYGLKFGVSKTLK